MPPETPPVTPEVKPTTPPVTPETPPTTPEARPAATPPETPSLLNEKPEAQAAPEKYTDFTVPEGYTLDADVAKEAGELFKGLNLSQESAQKLVDFYVGKTSEAADAPFKLWADTQKDWVDQVKADPDLGSKLPQVKATISKAIDGLGDAKLAGAFREAMDLTGAGNHPAFIKAFYKLAQKVTEGTHVTGGGPTKLGQTRPGDNSRSGPKALYPELP